MQALRIFAKAAKCMQSDES